jgi:hypothetical protein
VTVAHNLVEVEYTTISSTSCDAIWLCKLIAELIDQMLESKVGYCDNQSCIRLSENPMIHDHPKHININYYFLRDKV